MFDELEELLVVLLFVVPLVVLDVVLLMGVELNVVFFVVFEVELVILVKASWSGATSVSEAVV